MIEFPKVPPHKGFQLFGNALVSTAICVFEKEAPSVDDIMLVSANNDLSTINCFDFARIKQMLPLRFYPNGFSIPLVRNKDFQIIEKIYRNTVFIRDYIKSSSQGDLNLTNERKYFSNKHTEIKLIRGCHVHRFFTDINVDEYVEIGYKELIVERNRNAEYLVCQQISGMTDKHRFNFSKSRRENCIFGNSVNKIELKDEGLLDLFLAILNSKIVDWIFRKTSTNNHINIYEIEQIPIPMVTAQQEDEVVEVIQEILAAKKADPTADTLELEAEIDQLVYKLYGLTDEEIAIVEGRGGEDGAGAAPSGARSGAGGGTGAVNRRTGCAWRDQPGGTRRRSITEASNDEDEELE
jgi:hypothetical protein